MTTPGQGATRTIPAESLDFAIVALYLEIPFHSGLDVSGGSTNQTNLGVVDEQAGLRAP